VSYKVLELNPVALVLRSRRRGLFVLTYGEILTAERVAGRRQDLRLHVRTSNPLRVSCGTDRGVIEDALRERGVRVVDRWGCIIAPTLADFEAELMKRPARVRQSYDDA
jgi:hypothetical protein